MTLGPFTWVSVVSEGHDVAGEHVGLVRTQLVGKRGHVAVSAVPDGEGDLLRAAAVEPDVVVEVRGSERWIAGAGGTMTGNTERVVLSLAPGCRFGIVIQTGQGEGVLSLSWTVLARCLLLGASTLGAEKVLRRRRSGRALLKPLR